MEHPIKEIMTDAIAKMKELVDSNTVIGRPISTGDGTTILPVSKISFGFIEGGKDFATDKQKDLFGGAASSGASITPVGFLILRGDNVRLIQLAEGGAVADRVLNMVPEVLDRVEGFMKKDKKTDEFKTYKDVEKAVADARKNADGDKTEEENKEKKE